MDLIHTVARIFGTVVRDNTVAVPENYGTGYLWARNLPDGLSVMVCNILFNEDMLLNHIPSNGRQYFILQFNESLDDNEPAKQKQTGEHGFNMQQNVVLLTNSLMHSGFFVPAKVRTLCVKIIFEKNYLLNFMEGDVLDEFLSSYFSLLLKNGKVEPVDADYRQLMTELARLKTDHPLSTSFIQNRALMLIEKFILKFMAKLQTNTHAFKLKDDEISRLIKVESLLVKDYSGAPPTISSLSRTAAMSPTKLKKDFKALYGLPVYEYFQKNRMMRAKQLLLEGKYAIKEIGMMVGYTNLGHFAASFKKEFGTLPSEMNTANNLSQYSRHETAEDKLAN